MDKPHVLKKLLELKMMADEFPSFKGRSEIINKISNSIEFIGLYSCSDLYDNFITECTRAYKKGFVITEELGKAKAEKNTRRK